MANSPKWYRELYRKFEGARPDIIKAIDAMEEAGEINDSVDEVLMGEPEQTSESE